MRYPLIAVFFLALLVPAEAARSATGAEGPTQRDWMIQLVDSMGWSFGLPDEPTVADYQRILDGERLFRIEAEDAHRPDDVVADKKYRTFGAFSGEGWLSGISMPTVAHLRFLLPLAGTYQVTASVRLPGHRVRIGDRQFEVDGGPQFTEVTLGTMELPAGQTEAEVHLPANGGIDYIEFKAPPLNAIRPIGGWQPERLLGRDDMAVTAARVLDLESLLPPSDSTTTIEAESAGSIERAHITDVRHLGAPSAGRWVRAGTGHGQVGLVFSPPAAGVYTLSLRGAGNAPLKVSLNKRFERSLQFAPYLESLDLGSFFLPAGDNRLDLFLPPRGGVDSLVLHGRRSDGRDYLRLTGLPLAGGRPTPGEINAVLSLLAAIGSSR